ncbi:MAG: LLM class flavin-dependent oxidoreductase [Candidatus Rokubacteria bacterium]|nr:LLM class flavin-dependent oxidoreductase [Candidatus Rokubacteria bacterium]
MRTGLFFSLDTDGRQEPVDLYDEVLEQVRVADDIGYDSVWVAEHHFGDDQVLPSLQTMLAAIATTTKGVRIGTGVKVLPLDNPVRVAEDFAVVDIVSNGRLLFGVGAGHREEEFRGYRVEFGNRWERFSEALDIVVKAWTNDSFAYAGRYYKVPVLAALGSGGAAFSVEPYVRPYVVQWQRGGVRPKYLPVTPKPVQMPHPPIWVGASSEESIKFAAKRGYSLLVSPIETFAEVKQASLIYAAALQEAGRDIADVEMTTIREVYVAESREAARRDVMEPLAQLYSRYVGRPVDFSELNEDRFIVGDPDEVLDKIKVYQSEADVRHIVCRMSFPGLAHQRTLDSIRLFAAEVWSKLQA